jgi:delta14-sterol reductase
MARASPPPFEYEFGGPFGALATVLSLPLVVMGLTFLCSESYCLRGLELSTLPNAIQQLPDSVWDLLTGRAVALLAGWFAFQIFLERVLPGDVALGVKLPDGVRLPYRFNGHLAFWLTMVVACHGLPYIESGSALGLSHFALFKLHDWFAELAFTACAFSLALSLALYVGSFRAKGIILAEPGNSGNPVYDFFMGRELNPRIGTFDLKYFCELRPGLIGWAMLNVGAAAKQYHVLGHVSLPLGLVSLCQFHYVWDALHNEKSILTTMDITTDGFGFMLAFGDLAWVPFTYSLQSRYLATHDPSMPNWYYLAVFGLHLLGYRIFRGANGEKDAFRRDPSAPSVAHLRTMPTKRGTKLLISGWWGMARKINYTGDWLMGLSWCLFCGFDSIIPYFYAIYFAVLLVHRALRDDHACAKKYGDDWEKYKKHVPGLFFPRPRQVMGAIKKQS